MSEALLRAVIARILDPDSMEELKQFMISNEAEFDGDVEEHKLCHTDLHTQYSSIVEGHVAAVLSTNDTSESDFYEYCRQAKAEGEEWTVVFVELITASTDFEVFADLMRSKDKRGYFFQIMQMWKQSLATK